MDTDDLTSDEQQASAESPRHEGEPPKSVPITRVFFLGWGELFRSREAILLRHYRQVAALYDTQVEPDTTLDEARTLALAKQLPERSLSEYDLNVMEAKIVKVSRLIAFWQTFWLSILPLSLTAWFAVARWQANPQMNAGRILMTIGISIVLFYVILIAAAFLQSLFIRPFLALMNKILRMPEITG